MLAARGEAGTGRIKPRASTSTPGTLDLDGGHLPPPSDSLINVQSEANGLLALAFAHNYAAQLRTRRMLGAKGSLAQAMAHPVDATSASVQRPDPVPRNHRPQPLRPHPRSFPMVLLTF